MSVTRRCWLGQVGFGLLAPPWAAAKNVRCDIAIVGGGTGACAAALAAARAGYRVVMTEETAWIGGQLTAQAVPPDEHPWIEQFGATRTYREYRNRVRDYYRRNYPVTEALRHAPALNPGGGTVSRLTHEPRVSLAVLEEMLAPHVSAGRLAVLRRTRPAGADVEGARVRSVTLTDLDTGASRTLEAPYFLDATETGEVLPLARTEYVTGFESRRQTGEPRAPETAQPANHQAFTCCFAMDYLPGEDHTIDKPAEYAFWRDYRPQLRPPWSGPLLSLTTTHPITLQDRFIGFDPTGREPGWWTYRRIAARANFLPGAYPSDITLVNWPQNDYWLGNLVDVPPEEAIRHLQRAKQLSLSLLYWLQTEAPRADGGQGWPGLRLRGDVVGSADGLALYPYIRESRRIQAEFTVTELHVGAEARAQLTGKKGADLRAERFADSVGVGSYRIDLHPSSGGDNYIDISSLPFEIPLGSLIPLRMENLLPAAKNLGVTHLTNGCYRLHPVEWNIGEAAGALAAEALRTGETPRAIRNQPARLAAFQKSLLAQGFELRWPELTAR